MNRLPFDHFQYLLVHQLYRPILLSRPYFFLSVIFFFFIGGEKYEWRRIRSVDRQSSLGRRNTIETTRVQKRRKKRNDMETTDGWFDSWKVYFSYYAQYDIYFKLRIKSSRRACVFNTYRFRDCASRPIIRRLEELRDEFRIEPWKKLEIFKSQKAYRFWDRESFQHLISVSRNFPTSIRFIFSFFHSIEPGRGEISLVEQSARSSAALPGRSRFDHITLTVN